MRKKVAKCTEVRRKDRREETSKKEDRVGGGRVSGRQRVKFMRSKQRGDERHDRTK